MTSSEQSARETATSSQAGAAAPDAVQSEAARQYVPRQAPRHAADEAAAGPVGAATGLTITAAVLMVISGAWNFLEGLAALIRGSFFVVLPNYAYDISITGWGWFHLIVGAVVAAAGLALFTGRLWARMLGVAVVAVSAIVNFLYIPYQPVWSIAVIAIDGLIIWALLAPRASDFR
ncbi:MAG TPA: hypothetical protein VGM12_05600 [Trebonia sp.]|jgi:hypothetical protein